MKLTNIYLKIGMYYFITYLFTGILFVLSNSIDGLYEYIDLPMYGPTIGAIIMVLLEKENLLKFMKERFSLKGDAMCYLSLLIPVFIFGGLSYFTKVYWHFDKLNDRSTSSMTVRQAQ